MRNCIICDTRLQHFSHHGYCTKIPCKLEWQKRQQKHVKKLLKRVDNRYQQNKSEAINNVARYCNSDTEKINTVEIPRVEQDYILVSSERRQSFKQHLDTLCSSLEQEKEESIYSATLIAKGIDNIDKRLSAMCGLCQGKCCRRGFDTHSFIQRSTINRILANKQLDLNSKNLDDIKKEYLNHIPKLSMEGSCIYHTSRGCNLSPELRASICGEYFCENLYQYAHSMSEKNNKDTYYDAAIVRDNEKLKRLRIIASDGSFHDFI